MVESTKESCSRRPPTGSPHSSGSVHRVQFSPTIDELRHLEEGAELDRRPTAQEHRNRSASLRTVGEIDQSGGAPHTLAWAPGSEPGLGPDPARAKLSDHHLAAKHTPLVQCDITVVDLSKARVDVRRFDLPDSSNADFISAIDEPAPDWATGRWISVNGLSPDVVRAIGRHKGLHKLALEDLLAARNRSKVDWYPTHAFIVLTLQKVVDIASVYPLDLDDSSVTYSTGRRHAILQYLRSWAWPTPWRSLSPVVDDNSSSSSDSHSSNHAPTVDHGIYQPRPPMKTLQRYHGSPNLNRSRFMEQHSSLLAQDLVVMAEQVSIFLTSDNTVISFFETSADDIEQPLLRRLCQPGTVLRESGDTSLIAQAIIDAIVDLAVPLAEKYAFTIDDLEVDVLTNPTTQLSMRLYLVISEISKMLSLLTPTDSVVNALRDHRSNLPQEDAVRRLCDPTTGVVLTPMAYAYLGDVHDHCLIISEALTQTKQSAENLIALIFNSVSARQNVSMKSLTFIAIIFLPMTFITGFFGMNFNDFPDLDHNISYFWMVAIPTAFVTIVLVLFDTIVHSVKVLLRRSQVAALRRQTRREKERMLKYKKM